MNKVLEYFKNENKKITKTNIRVYGWQNEYDTQIIESVSKYLFEKLEIIENIAPSTNNNREGIIKDKYYITFHDTGDADKTHNAKFWSEAVYNEAWEQGVYACSYQYVVGNDGIYHNIPDNEIAWHAGDGTKFDYKLYDTNITGTEKGVVTISSDGYYEVNGQKSILLAPRIYKEKDGEVVLDRLAKTSDINDCGVLCKLIDGKYYIGETYFSRGYEKICNHGGNNNSIGIESCINEGTNIQLTWQKSAKLVCKLLKENNLTIDDIKQHHYFSGKNCPQTIRVNNKWEYFLSLVEAELICYDFIKEGYEIILECDNKYIMPNGIITEEGYEKAKKDKLEYKITTIKDDVKESITLYIE